MPDLTINLTAAERQALSELRADPTTPARLAVRTGVILELGMGASVHEVATRLGISMPTVRLWRRRYQEGGLARLKDTPRSGRPRRVVYGAEAGTTSERERQPALPRSGMASNPDEASSEWELDRLLWAARRTISRRGFAATRVADIAEEAGVSPSTIHYYFKTKNEILVQALLWASKRLLPPLVEDAASEDAISLMSRYIESTIPYPGVQRDEYLLEIDLWSNVRMHRGLLPAWESYEERWIAHVTELISLGIRTGAFKTTVPAGELAERLVALTDGLSAQTVINAARMPPPRARELILRFASEQLGIPRSALEAHGRS